MITEAIIGCFVAAIGALFSLLPDFSLPIIGIPTPAVGYASAFDRIVPLGYLATLTLATLVMILLLLLWDVIIWVYHQFWGAN